MNHIAELERRITAALVRIDGGIDFMAYQVARAAATAAPVEVVVQPQPQPFGGPVATLADGVAEAEIARLNEALDEARMANAQAQERLRAVLGGQAQAPLPGPAVGSANLIAERDALVAENSRLAGLLDGQGAELARLKKTVVALREQLRLMAEAQSEGRIEPHLINRAMLVELEALRAQRSAETAELEELIAALGPLATSRLEGEANG